MRILITGIVVFVIWSLFSVWLYTSQIRPARSNSVAEQPIQETQNIMADSVAQADTVIKQEVMIPDDMITYFQFDDAHFVNDQQTDKQAGEFITWLKNNPESMLTVIGHTDSKGSSEYNQALGLRRAKSMQKYLIEIGVEADKLETISKGEDEPVADQSTEEGRAKNRRAVITIKN